MSARRQHRSAATHARAVRYAFEQFERPGVLAENPNKGKRHASPLWFRFEFLVELQRAQSKAYAPTTYREPGGFGVAGRDAIGRHNPRMRTGPGYTI